MRKTITLSLEDGGTQKKFKITQMSAFAQQDFILRLALALAETEGAKINFEVADTNAGTVMSAFFNQIRERGFSCFAGLKIEKIRELTGDLLKCCVRVVDKYEQEISEDTIDDVKTLTALEAEAFKLNFFHRAENERNSESPEPITITRRKRD